jgi:hypothetical protein
MKYFDNDMDELFNKAGQDYPLNTNKKDWDAVLKTIQSGQSPIAKKSIFNRYLRFLPILLLLLVPVVFLVTQRLENKAGKSPVANTTVKKDDANSIEKQPKAAENRTNQPGTNANPVTTSSVKDDTPAKVMSENTQLKTDEVQTLKPENKTETNGDDDLQQVNKKTLPINLNSTNDNDHLSGNSAARRKLIDRRKRDDLAIDDLTIGEGERDLLPFFKQPMITFGEHAFDPSLLFNKLTSTDPNVPGQPGNVKATEKRKDLRRSRFYYGLKVGPDFTSIKGQRIENTGWAAGIILGYQFHPRWSIEMSALWSKKQYYTDGKYFDKTRANIPANVNIYYLDGGCNMVEVPIAVRYLFSKRENSFFATAGLNSYFMKKEDYAYEANAGTGVYEGYRTYKNTGSHFAATLQLTGGYQFKVFNKTNIRIEPYLQLPLQNVGIGRMPITSTGVHFGLIRNIR